MDQELNQKIDAFIEANKEQLLDDIAALVAINSVQSEPAEGAPFGAGSRAALDKTLELAEKMGLATRNCEGYIGYAELPGADPDKYLATICHVDVVPAGEGWSASPFEMRRQDGWILGRGVLDDKGPMVVTLYALKFLKELGVSLRYPIRALAGTNEETGMVSPACDGMILDFEGGVANNAVPDRASALVKAEMAGLKNAPHITLEPENGCVRIRGWGKAGHAASPAGTLNAIGLVVDYLLDNGLCSESERRYLEAVRKLHSSTAGEGLGIATSDGPFGPLTIIGGRMYMQDGRMFQTMDSRYPTSTNGEIIERAIRAAIGDGAALEDVDSADPFYIEADTPAIRACIDTYNEVTGKDEKPFTMGGGTYARHFPYAVSFGPESHDMVLPAFGGPMHGANESAPVDPLLQSVKIYILTLLKLEEIDF